MSRTRRAVPHWVYRDGLLSPAEWSRSQIPCDIGMPRTTDGRKVFGWNAVWGPKLKKYVKRLAARMRRRAGRTETTAD